MSQKYFNKTIFSYCLLILCISNCKKAPTLSLSAKNISHTIKKIGPFQAIINECSGFFYEEQQLFVINDSGGGAGLYQTTPNDLGFMQTISLIDVSNVDWEAITTTDTDIIIGDVGNNFGNRKDLKMLHFDKTNFAFQKAISLSYANQFDFAPSTTHNFDCEALFIKDHQYHVFTKNRGNTKTNLYTAPVDSNLFILQDSLEMPAFVTDAYYLASKQLCFLLGNQLVADTFQSFISIVQLTEATNLELITHLPLGINEQLEAITLKEGNVFYVGSEKERMNGGNLYEVKIEGIY